MNKTTERNILKTASFWYFEIVSVAMFFCIFACKTLELKGNIEWTWFLLLIYTIVSVITGTASVIIVNRIIAICKTRKKEQAKKKPSEVSITILRLSRKKYAFWVVLLAELLAYMPAFLAYFPGICSYDFPIQIGQVISGSYNEHHPLFHTLLLAFFRQIGISVFRDATAGIAILTLLQMILLAGVFAYGFTVLSKRDRCAFLLPLYLVYILLYPFHWYLGISMTKDTPFAIFFAIAVFALLKMGEKHRNKLYFDGIDCIFIAALTLAQLFRNNAPYAIVAFCALLAVTILIKKECFFIRVLILTVLSLLIAFAVGKGLSKACNATQADRREALSVPEQQIARVYNYQEDNLDEETKAFLQTIIWEPGLRAYRPEISDSVKEQTITYEIKNNAKTFIKTYLKLYIDYPGDMLNAVLALDSGYLNPFDATHASINNPNQEEGLGYVQTKFKAYGDEQNPIYEQTLLPKLRKFLDDLTTSNITQRVPVLRLLFTPGTTLWGYLLLIGYTIFQKRKENREKPTATKNAWVLWLPFWYLATLLLGPAVQLRYLYPVMILLVFLTAYFLGSPKEAEIVL